MDSKNARTLRAVFTDPVPANIRWRDIETLLKALGAELIEGRGSRVTVFLTSSKAVFHRPHPRPETSRYVVRAVCRFLIQAGIRPGTNKGSEDP